MLGRLLSIMCVGICLVAFSGCGMGRGAAFAPAPPQTKKAFAVEGMKDGQWQVVAGYPSSRAAMKRAADLRRGGDFQAVRIRSVALAAQP